MQQGNLFLDKTLNVDMALANVDPLESSLVDGITVFCVWFGFLCQIFITG